MERQAFPFTREIWMKRPSFVQVYGQHATSNTNNQSTSLQVKITDP